MKKSLILASLLVMGTANAFADSLAIQSGSSDLQIFISGDPGGAAEELVGYLAKSSIVPTQDSQGGLTYTALPVYGWKAIVPTVSFTFIMNLQPGEEKNLKLQSSFSAPNSPFSGGREPHGSLTVPDASSALLYKLMSQAGVKASANDKSKALVGKNITCWGFHGYPGNQTVLNPSCQITLN